MRVFVESFGGVHSLQKEILSDFFRHAFDGSGADNFFDAGSRIDGRLTSAWNWCSTIEQKPYFPVFLLTGFTGFEGKSRAQIQREIKAKEAAIKNLSRQYCSVGRRNKRQMGGMF